MKIRIGHGYDVHAFGSGDHVVLAGVKIPFERGLVAHSDGDVVIHALCDALLGAAGLGDIGGVFPDDDPKHAGQDSTEFLATVLERLAARKLAPGNADVTVIAQAPKLSAHIPAMRVGLARYLRLPEHSVNIKATTHEGLGALGRAEGIAAHAVVLLHESDEGE